MKIKKFLTIITIIIVLVSFSGCGTIKNVGTDTYTLMIYMCASDLESEGGYATDDIAEMLAATVDSKVNILIETGGTSNWQDYGIANNKNQIYKVEDGNLKLVDDSLGLQSMTDSHTLLNFINYCKNNYHADKYGLVLWDHGGGAVSGYGYDENNTDKEDTLTLDELKSSLQASNTNFDFIGFDACLMANVETAYAIKDNAKYLIASEESEPGNGWNYGKLLEQISSNTSQNTVEIGKCIADNFISENNNNGEEATLSIIDLSKINDVFSNLSEFIQLIDTESLANNRFSYISKAVSNSKAYGDGEVDTIDLTDFAKNVNNEKTQKLIESVNSAIVYNRTTSSVKNSNGLSIYFPYKDLEYYEKMLKVYPKIGIDEKYTNTLTKFVNLLVGGKNGNYTINSNTYSTNENYSQYGWYNQDIVNQSQSSYNKNEYNELKIQDKGEYYALEISDDDWNNIANITCEVFYDDGEGYLDLGSDDYYELDDKNNLKITFDRTWISINGRIVPFYSLESSEDYSKGKVPAYLNGELVNLIIVWDSNNQNGKVIGAESVDEYGNTTITQKGLIQIKNGDKIEPLFDYYNYNGEYKSSYTVGDPLVVDNDNLVVNYNDIGSGKYYVYYKITDVYGNDYYTESVEF